jgi:predicted NAD/FAD-dependent oxidoreductase
MTTAANQSNHDPDVIVVGAGLAGLAAAERLAARGRSVVIVDKGRSVGGRLATRRIGDARLDHGAQFMTVRSEEFAARIDAWRAAALVDIWHRGLGTDDGHPRYRATAGMNSLAKDLAAALPDDLVQIHCSQMAFSINPDDATNRWRVLIDDGSAWTAPAVIVTAPIPQAVSLLIDSGVELPEALAGIDYHRTIAVMVVLDGPSAVPPPGALGADALCDGIFSFVADQHLKRVSCHPAVTLHANDQWSLDNWDLDADAAAGAMIDAAAPWLGSAGIVEHQLKRWRLATPQRLWPERCWVSPDGAVVLAGDAFGTATTERSNAEGAYLSGRAAADAVSRDIPQR